MAKNLDKLAAIMRGALATAGRLPDDCETCYDFALLLAEMDEALAWATGEKRVLADDWHETYALWKASRIVADIREGGE